MTQFIINERVELISAGAGEFFFIISDVFITLRNNVKLQHQVVSI